MKVHVFFNVATIGIHWYFVTPITHKKCSHLA